MVKICFIYLIAFLSLPAISRAFQFDHWTSGMSIHEVMAVARDKDIPIHREGLISANKGFNPNTSTKYIGTDHNFYYREKLLGEKAKIELIFTPESKFLSAVKIRWPGIPKNSPFRRQVFDLLTHKHGKHGKKETHTFFEQLTWTIDEKNLVSMKTSANEVSLEYVDRAVSAQAESEARKIQEEKRRRALQRDGGKF